MSAGLASTSFWYSATARLDVAALERVLRRGVARVDLLLAGLLVDGASGARLVPAGEALRGELLQHLGQGLAQLLDGAVFWNSGIGRPWATSATSGTDGICMAWAICGTASMSTRPSRKRPSNSPDSVCRSSASVHALGRAGRALEGQQHRGRARGLEDLLEVLLGHRDGVRRGSAGRGCPLRSLQSRQIHRARPREGFLRHADILYDTLVLG